MGRPKSTLPFGPTTSIDLVASTLEQISDEVVVNQEHRGHGTYRIIQDIYKDAGPLAGLHAVVQECSSDWFILSACDTPFVNASVYEHLLLHVEESIDAVIPMYEGRYQPVSGIYHGRIYEALDTYLSQGGRKVSRFFDEIRVKVVTDYPGFSKKDLSMHFFNMNTPEEYEQAEEWFKKWKGEK